MLFLCSFCCSLPLSISGTGIDVPPRRVDEAHYQQLSELREMLRIEREKYNTMKLQLTAVEEVNKRRQMKLINEGQ